MTEPVSNLRPMRALLRNALAPWETHLAAAEAERAADPEAFARREEAERRDEAERQRAARVDSRRNRLLSHVDAETADVLAPALDGPPVVAGHRGSEDAAAAVVRFVATPARRTLLLWGPTGHGKTWAALWAFAAYGSCLVSGADVRPGDEWDALRARALRADLLVFDELGREGATEWFSSEAAGLLEARQTRGLRSIVTSNTPPGPADLTPKGKAFWRGKTLTDRYGDRLMDRLYDAEHGEVVRVQGAQSIRELRAAQRSAR